MHDIDETVDVVHGTQQLSLFNSVPQPLANATFATLRLHLIKVAARVLEAATRVGIAFAASCPDAALFAGIARWFRPAAP
jgi:hypothetical protein